MNKAIFNIYLRKNEKTVYYNQYYFDELFQPTWLEDNFVKTVIKEIDKGEVLGSYAIKTKDFWAISPYMLSGGTKTPILLKFIDEYIFNGSKVGDNCIQLLVKLARTKPISLILYHNMNFIGNENIIYNFPEIGYTTENLSEYLTILHKLRQEEGERR